MATITFAASPAVPVPSASANILIGIAGGTITVDQPVYLDSTTNTYLRANADSTGSAAVATAVGVALNSCVSGQRVMVCTADTAFVHGFTPGDITPGAFVYLDDTAGGFTVTASDLTTGDWITYIGQINNPETTMSIAPKAPVLS